MKRIFHLLAVVALFATTGCASFYTTQIDESNEQTGLRKITTVTKAKTFFEAKSDLATFAATQTDKSQILKIGKLSQEATATNATALIEAVVGAAVRAARPIP